MKLTAALRNPRFWPWLLILPGVILRLWNLGSCSPLWYDESYTSILIQLPFGQMLTAIRGDVHPPLYYLLLWLWKFLAGTSPAAMRFPSVVFSVLVLVTFHRLTAELGLTPRARLAGLAIMAFLPVNIYYAQEARMYALLQWLVIMQLLMVIRRRFWLLGLFTLLSLYTHNYALFYTACVVLVALGRELARPRAAYRAGIDGELSGTGIIPLFVSQLTAFVFWLPWVAVLIGQMDAIQGNYWIPSLSLGTVLNSVYYLLNGTAPDQLIPVSALSLWVGLLILALGALQKPRRVSLAVMAFGPLLLAVIASILWQPVLLYRGLIGMAAPLAALAGDSLARTSRRGLVVGLALLLPFVAGLVWLIGAGEVGMVKITPPFPDYRDDLPVVHLDEVTLMKSLTLENSYLLDAGCPEIAGALSPLTRKGIGEKRVTLDELPTEFIYVAQLFPLSSKCHEELYYQLSQGAEVIQENRYDLNQMGVWYVRRNGG